MPGKVFFNNCFIFLRIILLDWYKLSNIELLRSSNLMILLAVLSKGCISVTVPGVDSHQ